MKWRRRRWWRSRSRRKRKRRRRRRRRIRGRGRRWWRRRKRSACLPALMSFLNLFSPLILERAVLGYSEECWIVQETK